MPSEINIQNEFTQAACAVLLLQTSLATLNDVPLSQCSVLSAVKANAECAVQAAKGRPLTTSRQLQDLQSALASSYCNTVTANCISKALPSIKAVITLGQIVFST